MLKNCNYVKKLKVFLILSNLILRKMRPSILNKIKREIIEINQSNLGIHAYYKEDDIQSLKVLIIGPEDSPYYGGFLLFGVNFPTDYPFSPPNIKFLTPNQHLGCRLHPNLYQEGKVCLSILNTWGRNEWSPALTLEKVFLTIQGLLDNNPIVNEPGQEKHVKTSQEAKNYYNVALYRTLTVGVIEMFQHPQLPDQLRSIILNYFLKNRQIYLKQVEQLSEYDKINIKCFHGSETIDYNGIKKQLNDIFL